MLRYFPWSENIKKRSCRYLLQRYLGQFLEEKLTLEQLEVDLYNGTGAVTDLRLDCQALNELGETQGWPLEFVDGFITQMSVSIPWTTILKDDSFIQVIGLTITVQPRQRSESATSMFESMWSSMTSSMQLAAECLKQDNESASTPQPVEGLELFAQTIDSILSRVKVKLSNTRIRLEHVPVDSKTGVALEMLIKSIEYLDEAGSDPPSDSLETEKGKTYVVSTFSTKKICFEGVTFHTVEYPSKARTFSRSVISETQLSSEPCNESEEDTYKSVAENIFVDAAKTVPESILFAKLAGRQEIRLRMKQSEEAIGPKVDFQLTLGSLTMFITPRQFHVLSELVNGLSSPHLEDNSNVPMRTNAHMESKPMQKQDFERVEAQLTGELMAERGLTSMIKKHGWSAANIDDSDQEEEKFLPLSSKSDGNLMTDSFGSTGSLSSSITSNTSSLGSILPSSHRGSPYNTRRKKGTPHVDGDPGAEVSQIHVRIASFACILLHEDILTLSSSTGGDVLSPSSVTQMKQISENFFAELGLFAATGYGTSDLESASKAFDSALTHNHLRLIVAPMILEGNEKTNSQGVSVSGYLTMARVDLKECLYTPDSCDPSKMKSELINLLHFIHKNTSQEESRNFGKNLTTLPDIKLTFGKTQRAVRIAGERKYAYPRMEFSFNLEPCVIDIDISIVDRMCAIFNSQPICKTNNCGINMSMCNKANVAENNTALSNYNSEIKFFSQSVKLKLRFPIVDLRPAHDMSRLPWWQRAVRQDFLMGIFNECTVTHVSSHSQPSTDVKIRCKQLDVYYMESESDPGIHIGRTSVEDMSSNINLTNVICPTIMISVLPSHSPKGGLLDSSSDGELSEPFNQTGDSDFGSSRYPMGQSSAMLMDKLNPKNSNNSDRPGPFSSKKMVHESDTPHSKESEEDPEELVIPGDANELSDFANYSIKNSYIQIKCDLPVVSLQLNSKRLYEILYNRINSDLFLWEPSAPKTHYQPKPTNTLEPDVFESTNMQDSIHPAFSMCKSGLNYNSDSESSSSSTDSNVYYSIHEQKLKQSMKSKTLKSSYKTKSEKMSNICFSLRMGKGQFTMYTPVRNASSHVLPVQQGEIVFKTKELSLCHVGGVGGNAKNALLSLQAADVQLHHCGLVPLPNEKMPLRIYGSPLPSHLRCIIYSSEKGVKVKSHGHNDHKDFLSVAVSIKPSKDFVGFKVIKVAAGISNATLQHIMTISPHSWLNQLMDMFDVIDYPIPGYTPSTVITELHVHLWDCAIDYRPIHLPISTVITLGSFSISSNVVAKTNASNLRFIAEECALFLSDDLKTSSVDLRKDFVCVIDLGLFELSLRLNDKDITSVPRVDLRASNNKVHVRTCSDSFKALCRLINYLANDGDFTDPENVDSTGSDSCSTVHSHFTDRDSSSPFKESNLIGLNEQPREDACDLSVSQVQHVHDMMAEAMKENDEFQDAESFRGETAAKEGVEVFFFPDESSISKQFRETSPVLKSSKSSSTTDLPNMINQENNKDPTGDVKLDNNNSEVKINKTADDLPLTSVVAKELGDFTNNFNTMKINTTKPCNKSSADNTDDEFCILGEDIISLKKNMIEPEVKWLTDDPVHIYDNHFTVPVGKTDLLKPPKNFPPAVLRYTLCEMTLIWNMYGGNDFKINEKTNSNESDGNRNSSLKKNVTINDINSRQSPTFSNRLSERDPYNVLPKSPPGPQLYYMPQRNAHHTGMVYNKLSESVSQVHPKERMPGSPRETPWQHRGGPGRKHEVLMELQLNKIQFQHETYPANRVESSRQVLVISSVEVRDRLESSQINKFLYQYTSESRPKRKHANMVVIKAVHLRPDPKLTAQECCLKISLLPLRFNIDQDALLFLIGFFNSLGDNGAMKDGTMHSANSGSNQSLHSIGGSSRHSTPTHQPPIMSVNTSSHNTIKSVNSPRRPSNANKFGNDPDNVMISSDCVSEDSMSVRDEENECGNQLMDSYEAERLISENLILLEEDIKLDARRRSSSSGKSEATSFKDRISVPNDAVDDAPVYFRSVVFSPEVPIRLDYQGKRVDMTHGPLAGLLMGLGQLNCSELCLKPLSYRHGLLGVDRLIKWILQEWLSDIKRRQLPGLLGGVGPMHSLVQLFQGIRDLFWLPIEQYQRDGRFVRGLQRGASSFTTSTAMAALDITARIIHLIQATAETAYDMVSPSPGLRGTRGKGRRRRERARQPQDIREGVTNAYHLVKDGIGETAQAIADVAINEHAARGPVGAVGGVLRQIPPTVVAPWLLASAAAARVVGGVRATIAPADHRDHRDKWRAPRDQIDDNDHSLDADNYSDG